MVFSKEVRPAIKDSYPDASFGEIGKYIGEKWRNMSSEERQV